MAIFRTKMNFSILTDYPGVVRGVLANNTARSANRDAINAAINDAYTNNYTLIIPPGRYEIHGGAIIINNAYQTIRGDQGTYFVQFKLDSPCIHVGPPVGTASTAIEGVSLSNIYIKFSGTGTASVVSSALVGGHGLELTGCFFCNFQNIQIGDVNQGASGATSVPYTGVYCDPRGGTIPCFSCNFQNIRIKNYVYAGWHQYRNNFDAATGNTYSNIYISAGGAGDIRDISAVDGHLMYLGSCVQSSFNTINLEWSAAPRALHMEVCRGCTFQGLNIEGITLKPPSVVDAGLVSLYQSNVSFQGMIVQSTTVNSTQVSNPSIFRLQTDSFMSLDEFYPLNNTKTGISNFAQFRNWDGSGNARSHVRLGNCNYGDGDNLDLVDGYTFSSGNDGPLFGGLSDFNNFMRTTLANADATHYTWRTCGLIDLPAATTTKNLTLARQISSGVTTRIPRGVIRRVKASSTSTVQVKNYEATNLGAAIASGADATFFFDGTNWIRQYG